MAEGDFDFMQERFLIFIGILTALAALETLIPKRRILAVAKPRRWFANLGLNAIAVLCVHLPAPVTLAAVALFAAGHGLGAMNAYAVPAPIAFIAAIVLLDLAIYFQHVLSHKIPFLWRIHRVHHSDRDLDAGTALRFHPIEIGLSFLFKIVVIVAIGAPPAAVIAFEILLNAAAMFNHANIALSPRLDAVLRKAIVTPDMHRVHHSVHGEETDSNYGFNFSFWDRLFGTYSPQPRDGHRDMKIGLNAYADDRPARLTWMLALPFAADDESRARRRT